MISYIDISRKEDFGKYMLVIFILIVDFNRATLLFGLIPYIIAVATINFVIQFI